MEMQQNRRWCSPAMTIILVLGLMAFFGCATLDKDECLNADWFSIGYEDGAKGYKASRISSHRKACAKHGIAPDFTTYERGRQKGLGEWCTPRKGYQLGLNGRHYNGVCPKHLETAFVRALNQGREVYNYAAQVTKQEHDLKKMHADLDALEMDLADMEDELVRPGVSPRRRRQLLGEIRALEDDQSAMLNDIADMEKTIADMQNHLEGLRAQNPYR